MITNFLETPNSSFSKTLLSQIKAEIQNQFAKKSSRLIHQDNLDGEKHKGVKHV